MPQSLWEIQGNRRLVERLAGAGLPPAALFSGPEGVGKRTVAVLLAAKLNCASPRELDLCGVCQSCRKILAGESPDVMLFPQSDAPHIGIDEMRVLRREAQYRPFEGVTRCFIVDQAERMTPEAQNCLLKTLEEPPPTSRIMLISARPEALLATIRSRCCIFRFSALSRDQLIAFLRAHQVNQAETRTAFSQGSIGRALELVPEELCRERDLLLNLLDEWSRGGGFRAILKYTEKAPLSGRIRRAEDVARFLEILQSLGYDLYVTAVGRPDRLSHPDAAAKLSRIASRLSLKQIGCLLQETGRARRDLDRHVSPQMCFETLWLAAESVP